MFYRNSRLLFGLRRRLALTVFAALAGASTGWAATVTVVGNAADPVHPFDTPVYLNILGDSSNVVFSRDLASVAALDTLFTSQAGVTTRVDSAPLSGSSLSGVDLLVITNTVNSVLTYSSAEISAVGRFLQTGGDLLFFGQGGGAATASYNAFLGAIGTGIQFTDASFSGVKFDPSLESTAISSADDRFRVDGGFTALTGGTAVAGNAQGVFLATDEIAPTPVPIPASVPMLAMGLAMLALLRRRQRS